MLKQILVSIFICLTTIIAVIFFFPQPSLGQEVLLSPLANSSYSQTGNNSNPIPFAETDRKDEPSLQHILLLGLDARMNDTKPRCDAIHILTINPKEKSLTITSISRGTPITAEGTPENTYIANLCHNLGVDATIPYIGKIAQIHVDHVIKIGFSQTFGLLRLMQLPTSTLQFLRNRSYPTGDHQRSHNQAVFIKDSLVNYLSSYASFPKPLRYIAYTLIDTSLSFDQTEDILNTLLQMQIQNNPDHIYLITQPSSDTVMVDMHANQTRFTTVENPEKDSQYQLFQKNLISSLENVISRASSFLEKNNKKSAFKLISPPFGHKIWLQIGDTATRNHYHLQLLTLYVLASDDKKNSSYVLDFMTQMDQTGEKDFYNQAEELLNQIKGYKTIEP